MPDSGCERPLSANGLKRRHSEVSEQESKRQRTSPGKNPPIATEPETEEVKHASPRTRDAPAQAKPTESKPQQPSTADRKESRRKSTVTDEKQRSKRLFGALLGNLNQPGDRTSKRRQEIEARRKAELQRQDDERIEDKQRHIDQLAEQRKKAQKKVDEESMRIRHAYLLKMANFLQTGSEPKLYYRPWELRPDEEDRVDQQISEVEALIERELGEFEGRPVKVVEPADRNDQARSMPDDLSKDSDAQLKPQQLARVPEDDVADTKDIEPATEPQDKSATAANGDKPAGEVLDSHPTDNASGDHEAFVVADSTADGATAVLEQKQEDEEGDQVVEGEEDTVIY